MESRTTDVKLDNDLKSIAHIDNKEALITDPEKVFQLVSQIPPTLASRFLDYYRETACFKELEDNYLSKKTDLSLYESACFALATNDIQKINAADLEVVVSRLKETHKTDNAILACLAGLHFTALARKNIPGKTGMTDYFQWRDILSKRTQITFVNLANANLSEALLNNQDFTGANLRNAQLNNAKLENIKLTGANLTKANLTFAVLLSAQMQDVILDGCKLHGACLDEANLEGVTETNGANFTGVSLCSANLKNANLQKIVIHHDVVFKFSHGLRGYANFSKANLEGSNLEGLKLDQVILIDAILTNTLLNNAELDGSTFFNNSLMQTTEGNDEATLLLQFYHQLNKIHGQIDGHIKIHELRQGIARSLISHAESMEDHPLALKLLEQASNHNMFSHRKMLSSAAAWGGSTWVGRMFVDPATVASASQGLLMAACGKLRTKIAENAKEDEAVSAGMAKLSMQS